ncbi:methyl-accepting chemotaxis protein i [Pantoea agglomerans]|nr:methyl-accepting chemotaxis protein i [Pantoea agglomerans]
MQHSLLDAVESIRDKAVILHREAGDIASGNADLSDKTGSQATALE